MPGFYIDVYNAAGTKTNDTAVDVAGVRLVERLNRIGEIGFTLPAVIARDAGLTKGKRYQVHHELLGDLGQFRHDDLDVDADNRLATIRALDSLQDLADKSVGFNWSYSDVASSTVLSDLCTYAGWTVSYESGVVLGNVTLEFQGESVMQGLDAVRYATRGYFRRNGPTAIKFGKFSNLGSTWNLYGGFTYGGGLYKGDLSAVPADTRAWLINPGALSSENQAPAEYATITKLKRQQKGSAVVNRIIPLGAGQGQTQVDLRYSTRTSPYTIQTRLNHDGVTYTYYIEDADSITANGEIERTVPFNDVRPITNSLADLTAAANGVYDMAVAYLQRFKNPQEVYSVSCVNLPAAALPGEIVVAQFYGVMETESGARAFLTLENAPFYVIERATNFGETGNPTYDLVISTSGEAQASVIDVFSNVLKDLDKFKVRPPVSQSLYAKASPTMPIDPTRYVQLKFEIGAEVLLLNELKVEFQLMKLRSSTSNVANAAQTVGSTGDGGGTTATSSSGGGTTQTTTSGGGTTQTTTSGGGHTATSSSGGGTVSASGGSSASHTHGLWISVGSSGNYVIFDGYALHTVGGVSAQIQTEYGGGFHTHDVTVPDHSHSVTIPNHSHSVTIPAHSHSVTIPNHSHSVTIPNHSHSVTIPAHGHTLQFGVVDDSQTPQTVTVKVNGVAVGNIRNAETGTFVGSSASGEGVFVVDILATLEAQGDWRNRVHTIRFDCGSERGQLFAQVRGRVTIQPIAV